MTVVFATALAVVILLVVMLVAPTEHEEKLSGVQVDPTLEWDNLTPGDNRGGNVMDVPQGSGAFVWDIETDKGVFYQIFGQRLEPEPNGVTRVFGPMARIHLKRHKRVIEVRADDATLVAPQRQPRSGHFIGNVVLRLLEAPEDRAISYATDSPHVVFKVFLNEAVFDLELGEIASADPIFLTSRQVDFKGTGLIINYDQVAKRVQRLVVARGKYMVISRGIGDSVALGEDDHDNTPDNTPRDDAGRPVVDVEATTRRTDHPQYYRATFNHNVVVTSTGSRIDECDLLHVNFAVTSELDSSRLIDEPRDKPAATPSSRLPVAPAPNLPTGAVLGQLITRSLGQAATPEAVSAEVEQMAEPPTGDAPSQPQPKKIDNDPRSMFAGGADDVHITWSGPLSVQPLDEKPEIMQGPDDLAFAFEGSPLRITTPDSDLMVRTPKLTYSQQAALLDLIGDAEQPVVFDTDAYGVMTVPKMSVVPDEARIYLLGKGRWQAHGDSAVLSAVNPQWEIEGQYDRLPPGSQMDWRDRVVLDLYTDTTGVPKLDNLKAVKTATFHGDVNVAHPAFDMRGDKLVVGLDPPAEQAAPEAGALGKQRINDLFAEGNVHVISRSDDPDMQLSVRSDKLTIGLESEGDRIRPTALLAQGNVDVQRNNLNLQSNDLQVDLMETVYQPAEPDPSDIHVSDPTEEAAKPEDGDDEPRQKLEIKTVTARDRVRVRVIDEGIRVYADRMVAEGDQIEFFGKSEMLPARMLNDEGMLTAGHFVLNQQSQTLYAIGPGSFDVFAKRKDEGGQRDVEVLMVTTWKDRMFFQNRNNLAHFLGDVLVRGKREDATTQLRAEDLKLDFIEVEKETSPISNESQLSLRERLTAGDRALHMITARDNVRFEAANWGPAIRDLPLTRVSIQGEFITFDRPSEQVQIHGPGRMGIEDYRPKDTSEDAPDPTDPLVNVTGRGITLFTWKGSGILDFYNNDMRLRDQAQMLHRPLGATDASQDVQLDCQRFVADLEESGGLGMITESNEPQPNLKAIRASDRVRLLGSKYEIYTDQMDYTHFNQTVVLNSEEGGPRSRIIDNSSGAAMYADQFRWDLMRDVIEVIDPGRSTAPIR